MEAVNLMQRQFHVQIFISYLQPEWSPWEQWFDLLIWLFSISMFQVLFSSVQFTSVAQSCPNLCDPMNCSTPGLPVHHQLPQFTQTDVHQIGDAIKPSHPLSSRFLPAPNPSQHQTLSKESTLHLRWPNYCSFSFTIIPSKEIPGPISFRMDWLGLLAVQGSLLIITYWIFKNGKIYI